jgi:hypothetical protein
MPFSDMSLDRLGDETSNIVTWTMKIGATKQAALEQQ